MAFIEDLSYETKCRKCNQINEWFVAKRWDLTYKIFEKEMSRLMLEPVVAECDCTTRDKTIQDIVSFINDVDFKPQKPKFLTNKKPAK